MARREAAPAVLVAALADIVLAFVSAWRGWHLYQGSYWWVWLLLALPALAVFVVFLLGLGGSASAASIGARLRSCSSAPSRSRTSPASRS